MVYVYSSPVLVGCNVFWIFVMTKMLLKTKSLLIATKQLVFFFAQKSVNNQLHQMYFYTVHVYNFLTKWNTLVCG